MPRLAATLLVGTVLGYLTGSLPAPDANRVARGPDGSAGRDRGAGRRRPSPPPSLRCPRLRLYPDAPERPRHWSADEIATIYEARVARLRSPDAADAAASFEGQSFRDALDCPARSRGTPHGPALERHRCHEPVRRRRPARGGVGLLRDGGWHGAGWRPAATSRTASRVACPSPRPRRRCCSRVSSTASPSRDATVFDVGPGDWVAHPAQRASRARLRTAGST